MTLQDAPVVRILPVQVDPVQAERLAQPESARPQQRPHRMPTAVDSELEEPLELFLRQGGHLSGSRPRRCDQFPWVPLCQTPVHSLVEGSVQNGMDLFDGPVRKA